MSKVLWSHTLAAPRATSSAHALASPRPFGAIVAFRLGLALALTLALAMVGTCAHAAPASTIARAAVHTGG